MPRQYELSYRLRKGRNKDPDQAETVTESSKKPTGCLAFCTCLACMTPQTRNVLCGCITLVCLLCVAIVFFILGGVYSLKDLYILGATILVGCLISTGIFIKYHLLPYRKHRRQVADEVGSTQELQEVVQEEKPQDRGAPKILETASLATYLSKVAQTRKQSVTVESSKRQAFPVSSAISEIEEPALKETASTSSALVTSSLVAQQFEAVPSDQTLPRHEASSESYSGSSRPPSPEAVVDGHSNEPPLQALPPTPSSPFSPPPSPPQSQSSPTQSPAPFQQESPAPSPPHTPSPTSVDIVDASTKDSTYANSFPGNTSFMTGNSDLDKTVELERSLPEALSVGPLVLTTEAVVSNIQEGDSNILFTKTANHEATPRKQKKKKKKKKSKEYDVLVTETTTANFNVAMKDMSLEETLDSRPASKKKRKKKRKRKGDEGRSLPVGASSSDDDKGFLDSRPKYRSKHSRKDKNGSSMSGENDNHISEYVHLPEYERTDGGLKDQRFDDKRLGVIYTVESEV